MVILHLQPCRLTSIQIWSMNIDTYIKIHRSRWNFFQPVRTRILDIVICDFQCSLMCDIPTTYYNGYKPMSMNSLRSRRQSGRPASTWMFILYLQHYIAVWAWYSTSMDMDMEICNLLRHYYHIQYGISETRQTLG